MDGLSRSLSVIEAVFHTISACQPLLLEQLREFYRDHQVGRTLLDKFQSPEGSASSFSTRQGLLYFRDRLFIPLESGLRTLLLQEAHASPTGGHSGVKGTLTRLAASNGYRCQTNGEGVQNLPRKQVFQLETYGTSTTLTHPYIGIGRYRNGLYNTPAAF